MNTLEMVELIPQFAQVKSFYRKAFTLKNGNKHSLLSYDTLVCEIENGVISFIEYHSLTSNKHINEFLKQNGLRTMTKKEIEQLENKLKGS